MSTELDESRDAIESIEKSFEEKIKYTDHGFILFSRKWMGRDLARYPSAFTIYSHLIAWANHKDGKLKRGQIAIGERDFGDILGMSITTVRKWLRWLQERNWILLEPVRWGSQRGTIITVLNYDFSQSFKTYDRPSEDQKMILTPAPLEDQKMILTSILEDQISILTPPSEDQKMIPHILHKTNTNTGDASRHRCPNGQISPGGGIKGDLTVTIKEQCQALYAHIDSL